MKTKRLKNKALLRLNKTTIVNLNHREMVKIKVGAIEDGVEVNDGLGSLDSRCCNETTVIHPQKPCLSFATDCNETITVEPIPATDTC